MNDHVLQCYLLIVYVKMADSCLQRVLDAYKPVVSLFLISTQLISLALQSVYVYVEILQATTCQTLSNWEAK